MLKHSVRVSLFVFALGLGLPRASQSKTYHLSKIQGPLGFATAYEDFISGLKVGDVLIFSNGRAEGVQEIFDYTQTKFISIGNGHTLRLPLHRFSEVSETSIDQFVAGLTHLKLLIPDLEVLKTYDYLPHEYVEVDRLSRFVALRDFFRDVRARSARDPLLHFTPTELKDAKRRFLDFVRITSPLVYLGDLTTENLVYSKTRGWIFLDVNDQHLLYTELGWSRNVFTYLHPPENLLRQINRIVLAERKGQPLDECEEALSVEDLHAIIKKRKYN